MKKVLQHKETRKFLTAKGRFTPSPDRACAYSSITAAMVFCTKLKLDLTEFIYHVVDTDPRAVDCPRIPA